jgi:hypothetical protein
VTTVFCPICHRLIPWDRTPPYRVDRDGSTVLLTRIPRESDPAWRDRLIAAYRPCGEVGAPGTHLLPYDYADYVPITIGMIGHSKAGKTHLLAAMISRLCSNDPTLHRLGLRVGPLDVGVHQRYLNESVTPLIVQRRELEGTPADARVEFCDALKVTNAAGRSFAVTFFDLAGERLSRNDEEVRFYASADALMFVVDPETLPERGERNASGDASFEVALRRLEARRRPPGGYSFRPVAAAVVVGKADLIRFSDRTVSNWLAFGSPDEEVDLSTLERESEDVYTYLARRGAHSWLRPAQECYRSTLHFASATNGPAREGVYPGSFRQCRVLKPLLSIFAMTPILDGHALLPAGQEQPA